MGRLGLCGGCGPRLRLGTWLHGCVGLRLGRLGSCSEAREPGVGLLGPGLHLGGPGLHLADEGLGLLDPLEPFAQIHLLAHQKAENTSDQQTGQPSDQGAEPGADHCADHDQQHSHGVHQGAGSASVLISRNSSNPATPISRPMPDCL